MLVKLCLLRSSSFSSDQINGTADTNETEQLKSKQNAEACAKQILQGG